MPLIVVKAYPKDEKIKQEVAEEITRVFTEKWGCARDAVTVKIESYAPDVWAKEIKEKEIDSHKEEMLILEGKPQFAAGKES